MSNFWEEMSCPVHQTVTVRGRDISRGSRVRLVPSARGDIFDKVLAGRIGIVEGIEEDDEGRVLFAVTFEDDPGRDLGDARQPGHRFFFSEEEVEPLDAASSVGRRILVAGIGNVFLGDDGFGVEVVRRLASERLSAGVDVVDFGIRSLDLVYALQEDYQTVLMVDAMPRGEAPGTLYLLEPELDEDDAEAALETHNLDPVEVLRFARKMGRVPPRTLVLGCEPANVGAEPYGEVLVELSDPVRAAVEEAAKLLISLVHEELEAQSTNAPPVGGREEKERRTI